MLAARETEYPEMAVRAGDDLDARADAAATINSAATRDVGKNTIGGFITFIAGLGRRGPFSW